MRNEGVELRHFGRRNNDVKIGLETARFVELVQEDVVLGQCVLSFKISMSGFCLAYDVAVAPRVIGIDVRSLVFLISVTIIVEGTHSRMIDDTICSKDSETAFFEDIEELIDKSGVFFGVIPEMHGANGPDLR